MKLDNGTAVKKIDYRVKKLESEKDRRWLLDNIQEGPSTDAIDRLLQCRRILAESSDSGSVVQCVGLLYPKPKDNGEES